MTGARTLWEAAGVSGNVVIAGAFLCIGVTLTERLIQDSNLYGPHGKEVNYLFRLDMALSIKWGHPVYGGDSDGQHN